MKSSFIFPPAIVCLISTAWSDVLISQYYEGTSNNKWIELTNTSGTAVSLDGFVLTRWSNAATNDWKTDGNTPGGSLDLSGNSIPANGFLLIGNSSAVLPSYASGDLLSGVLSFNGDDSVVLYDTNGGGAVGDTSAIADAIGFSDPGDPGGNTSFYRISNGVGYDLVAGSTAEDFPAVWAEKTNAEVDSATTADDWYLDNFNSTTNESLSVSLNPTTISEEGGTGLVDVTVTRTGSTAAALDVTLESSDETEAVIPSPNRQIPLGQASETFTMAIDAVDDVLADGTQIVTITATALGLNPGTAELSVTDGGDVAPIVINEILADPPSGATGDANSDGNPNTTDDEFVEIVNISGSDLDISSWQLSDSFSTRHIFPAGTILPTDCAIVVFGGGSVDSLGGSAIYQVASEGSLNLTNSGDTVTVFNASNDPVASHTYGSEGGSNESLTRDVDLTGAFTGHTTATGSGGAPFSPGTLIDGSQFCPVLGNLGVSVNPSSMSESGGTLTATITRTGDLTDAVTVFVNIDDATEAVADLVTPGEVIIPATAGSVQVTVNAVDDLAADGTQVVTIEVVAPRYNPASTTFDVTDDGDGPFTDLVINEFLYDPAGDANGDGTTDASEDEFVELLNVSGSDFDLSGFQLHDSIGLRHTFPANTVLGDQQAIVVFGGGSPVGLFGGSVVQTASEGQLGLTNSGDSVILKGPGGGELLRVDYDGSVEDQSLTRDPDETGAFVAHSSATGSGGDPYSPGSKVTGSPFDGGTAGSTEIIIEAFDIDVDNTLVNVTVGGLVPNVTYSLQSSFDLGETVAWLSIFSFTINDGTEGPPGSYSFSFLDQSILFETEQQYRIVQP